MNSNLIILPILFPLIAAILTAFFPKRIRLNRGITFITLCLSLAGSAWMAYRVFTDGAFTLEFGDWVAPYGIVFVADPLSVILVLTTFIIAFSSFLYACISLTKLIETSYFYFFFHSLILGVAGSFLTGDLFNLFVFFEVLLMASYGLIVLGGKRVQFRESVKYILINLFSSIVFVMTVSFVYSMTGTVNMAQIAERVPQLNQPGTMTVVAILLFTVFATKSALFPLYTWLPHSYAAPTPVVSALFGALLTKVGIYSIMRMFTLVFVQDTSYTHQLFLYIAGFTMIFGVIGALSTKNVKLIIAYNIIPAVGYILLGIGVATELSLSGSVFYLVHDMVIKAALFILIGLLVQYSGTSDLRQIQGVMKKAPGLGWLFFIACLALAGIPPFSGFIGKYLLLQSAVEEGYYVLTGIGLLTSLLILFSVMRIFIWGFWGETSENIASLPPLKSRKLTPAILLVSLSIVLGLGAEWFMPAILEVGGYLLDPESYIQSVLKE
ncbi:Na+/H+ antiporter subunit D [Bacillaceae bacterium SIJ1]|uniref:Na+/H+ antiporter subunit D n=1 Tax=Litoribacterium kuwaitense TaxID=1398745 RepID=UPI0013EA17B7|nr:Na+/H+ antiporter subunit D [Litoribacterium kuwaitense]NGP43479.1 Na+/H+ antiporter subunit D [Litoribacterium kuwaitense]